MTVEQLHKFLEQGLKSNTIDPRAQVVLSAIPFERVSIVAVQYDKVARTVNISSYQPNDA